MGTRAWLAGNGGQSVTRDGNNGMAGDRDQGVARDNRELGQRPDKGEGSITADGHQGRVPGAPGPIRGRTGEREERRDLGKGVRGGMGTVGWGPWDGDPSVTAGSAETGDRGVAGTVPRTQPGPLRRRAGGGGGAGPWPPQPPGPPSRTARPLSAAAGGHYLIPGDQWPPLPPAPPPPRARPAAAIKPRTEPRAPPRLLHRPPQRRAVRPPRTDRRHARVHLHPRGPSGRADRQCVLGAVLPGARHPARRADAQRQDHRRGGRLLQHVLQRDGRRQARAPGRVRGPGAHGDRRGAHRHVPAALPPRAADHGQGGCGQQLRPRPLHHRQGDHRPGP